MRIFIWLASFLVSVGCEGISLFLVPRQFVSSNL